MSVCDEGWEWDWQPNTCPFAAILRALPTASDEQIEAATDALTGKVQHYPEKWSIHWIVTPPMERDKGGE